MKFKSSIYWRHVLTAILTGLCLSVLTIPISTQAEMGLQSDFDICLQDDSSGDTLKFNSITGQYLYTRCSDGATLSGRGQIQRVYCEVRLYDGQRVSATFIHCPIGKSNIGQASVSFGLFGPTCSLKDTNPVTSTCECNQTMAQIFPVRQTGATQAQADVLRQALGLGREIRLPDGSLQFIDSQNYLKVPTEDIATDPGLPPDEGQMQTKSERFKFEDSFFTNPQPFPKDRAQFLTQQAFNRADLLPAGSNPASSNNQFEFVPVGGQQTGQPLPALKVPIDTHVTFSFQLAGKPLIGPGAHASMTFDRNGNLTRLQHAMRFVGSGTTVPIMTADQAKKECTARLSAQTTAPQTVEVQPPQLVYFAPPLSQQNVDTIFPHYQCNGTIPDDRGGRALLRPITISAIVDRAPQVSLSVNADGCTVRAAADATGTPPFSFSFSSSSTQIPAQQNANDPTVTYRIFPKPDRGQVTSETVTVVVTDANGLTAIATQTIKLASPCPLPQEGFEQLAQPLIGGVVDVGIEWIGTSQGLPGSAGSAANYVSRFSAAGIPIRFNWGDFNAWERDYKDLGQTSSGLDHQYVDNADLAFYTGHANGDGFTFPGSNDDGFLHFMDKPQWGNNNDVEWVAIAACGPLQDTSSGQLWWQRWGPAFQRLHIFAGYENVSYDQTVEGDAFPRWLLGYSFGFFTFPPQPVRVAWVLMAQEAQPSGVTWGVMGVCGPNAVTSWNDFFWGKGSVSPDIPASSITGFWKISGDS